MEITEKWNLERDGIPSPIDICRLICRSKGTKREKIKECLQYIVLYPIIVIALIAIIQEGTTPSNTDDDGIRLP